MGWRLIVYCVLALALTGSFLFITIENESLSSKDNNSSIFNAKEIENFMDEFDKIDVDEISPRQSLEFLYKLKSKRQSNGKSKFKK